MIELFSIVATTATAALATPPAVSLVSRWKPKNKNASGPGQECTAISDRAVDTVRQESINSRTNFRSGRSRQHCLVEIDRIVQESEDTKSFYFTSVDGEDLAPFRSGQHIIVERPATNTAPVSHRCYTLSASPSESTWRITVRRQAAMQDGSSFSAWVHREWRVGDRLRVRGPRGSFVLDSAEATKPVVFLSAGVGITPISAMLQDELSYPRSRPKWVFHQIRELTNAPLVHELILLVESSTNCQATIAISQLETIPKCLSKNVRLEKGKLDFSQIPNMVGTADVTVLMCGPVAWMQAARLALVQSGIPDAQIFDESFGAPDEEMSISSSSSKTTESQSTFQVTLEATGQTGRYQSDTTSLLSHVRKAGVDLPASCRSGHCGTCVVKLLRGQVKYTKQPQAEIAADEILPCVCHPVSDVAIYV